MVVEPVGRRLLEDRIAATLPKVYGQCGRAEARGQCWNSAAALESESRAALPKMPSSLRTRHQVEPAAAQ
jgi:hypothetical protein